jgi:hypothetical protein
MAEYVSPEPVVQISRVQELARDLVVIPNRRVQLVPNIGVIGGTHSVLVVDAGMGGDRRRGPGADDRAASRMPDRSGFSRASAACAPNTCRD